MPALDLRNLRGAPINEGAPATLPAAPIPDTAPQPSGGATPYGGTPYGGTPRNRGSAESSGASQPGEATDEN